MTRYEPEVKAAVMAELLAGQAVSKVADDYNIPVGTVKGWKSRGINNSELTVVPTQKKEQIGELLLDLLQDNLVTQRTILQTMQDVNYLKSQDASDLAVLFGVISDKAFRMLEAFERGTRDEN